MFMSATPRIYELENTDEDDDYFDIFGNKAYHMEMKEAIKNKYIADYKIYIPSIHENKKKVIEDIYNEIGILNIDKTYEAKAIFLYKCLTYYGTKKTIVYFKDITDMKNFNIAFKMLNKYYAIDYFIKMITYKITQKEKTEYINKFTNTKNKFCLLFSVHILDECVDIPCCDSIYITYNSNSKIKNVQRMCRANRINDNKNKVAKIFLWCNELDKLPDFLSSVKEFDDEYKDKIVNVQSSYSGYNDEKVEKKDTLGIDKYVVNVMEYKRLSWDKIKNLLLKFCEKEKRCPIQKEQYKNHNIGMWLQTQKKKIKNKDDDIYKKLSINQYVKKNLDEYLINKNKNKDKEKLEWDQLKELLFEFCEKEKRCPIQKEQYKNHNIGMRLQTQKKKIKNKDDDIYKKLSINQYVKKNLDKYLINKNKNKDKEKLEWDQLKELLFEFCEKEKRCPINKKQYKNHNIGMWLQNQKQKIENKDNDIYKKLSINQYVKKNLDEYLINKNKNKDKEKLEWEQLKELLFEFCEKEKRCPINKEQYKNHNISKWLQHQKQKIKNKDDDIYKKLSINQYVKKNLDKYLINKNKNKDKEKLEWDQLKELLFEFCEKEKRCPIQKEQYKNHNIGMRLQTQKQKIKNKDDDIYKKLSINQYVKKNLDKYLINKNKNKDKEKLEWEQLKELLFEFCEKEKRCPIQKEQYKNHNIGMWLQHKKQKIKNKDDDIYKKLSINQYVKKNLDKYLINKNKNKDKEKLEWEQLKELLFEFCEKEKRCPIQKEQYKNHNIGTWLQHQKQKIKNKDDDIYKKLSINQYVKKNLDEYLINNFLYISSSLFFIF